MPPAYVTPEQCKSSRKWIMRWLKAVSVGVGLFLGIAGYAVICAHDAERQAQAAESEAANTKDALREIHIDVREIRAAVFRIENGEK